MVNFPTTLIIGLGGVGSEITAEIYRKFMKTYPSDIERRNIICLCLDTDSGDIAKRKKILPHLCGAHPGGRAGGGEPGRCEFHVRLGRAGSPPVHLRFFSRGGRASRWADRGQRRGIRRTLSGKEMGPHPAADPRQT